MHLRLQRTHKIEHRNTTLSGRLLSSVVCSLVLLEEHQGDVESHAPAALALWALLMSPLKSRPL